MFSQNSLHPFARSDNIVCSKISYTYKKKKKKEKQPSSNSWKSFYSFSKNKNFFELELAQNSLHSPKKTIFYTCAKKLKSFVLGAVFFILVKLSKVLNKTIKAISMFERL